MLAELQSKISSGDGGDNSYLSKVGQSAQQLWDTAGILDTQAPLAPIPEMPKQEEEKEKEEEEAREAQPEKAGSQGASVGDGQGG